MDQEQEHPFVKVSKKKNKGNEVNNPPTNEGGSMNPNEITSQASVQEAKKQPSPEQSKNRKQLAKILPIAAAMNRSVKGLPPDPGITARINKNKPAVKDIPYKDRAKALKKENQKVSGFEKDAADYASRYLAQKARTPDFSQTRFNVHPDTAKALGSAPQPKKLSTALSKRLTVRGAKPATGALVPVKDAEPKPNIKVQYTHDLDVVKYPKYQLQHSAIKPYHQQMQEYEQGKSPLNRQHLLAAIEKSRHDAYAKVDRLVGAAQAQHELSTRQFDQAPASHWKKEANAMRRDVDAEHSEKIRHINHLFNQHAITHGEPYHANEISAEGYVRGTKETSTATQHPKKGIFSRIKKKLGFGEDIAMARLEKIKQIAEARNMFKASSSGAGRTRGGGVIRRQGATGRAKSPVTMYKKQSQQTVKGVSKTVKSRQQAAAIAIAKQKQQGTLQQTRARANQYRIN